MGITATILAARMPVGNQVFRGIPNPAIFPRLNHPVENDLALGVQPNPLRPLNFSLTASDRIQ
jgi:hypothetical protein